MPSLFERRLANSLLTDLNNTQGRQLFEHVAQACTVTGMLPQEVAWLPIPWIKARLIQADASLSDCQACMNRSLANAVMSGETNGVHLI